MIRNTLFCLPTCARILFYSTGILRLSQINLDRREALKFLITSRRPTFARGKRSGTTNIVEECCYEGCVSEEVQEYC